MPTLSRSGPAPTAPRLHCAHCDGPARLIIIEPHIQEPEKEWHVFRCDSCRATRAYLTVR